jgi:hypothetical protein
MGHAPIVMLAVAASGCLDLGPLRGAAIPSTEDMSKGGAIVLPRADLGAQTVALTEEDLTWDGQKIDDSADLEISTKAGNKRAFLRFATPTEPFDYASFQIFVNSGGGTLHVYRAGAAWSRNVPPAAVPLEPTGLSINIPTKGKGYGLDISQIATQWATGQVPNFGLVLEAGPDELLVVSSFDNGAVSEHPKLFLANL